MKIGIITHNYSAKKTDVKNAGIFVADFAAELEKEETTFVFDLKLPPIPETPFGFLNPLFAYQLKTFFQKSTLDCIDFVTTNKIDFLLAMWAQPAGIIAAQVKKKLGTPYAVWSLGSDIHTYAEMPIIRQLTRNALKEASLLFANSYSLSEKVAQLSDSTCHFLPAVTQFYTRSSKPLQFDKKLHHFLFVGRLEKVKGPDILIQAAHILNKDVSTFAIHFLGTGSEQKKLAKMIETFSLQKKIHLVGNSDRKTVAQYMLSCDSLVIPSRRESLPLVLIEAARVGLPVIASNVGDCGRFIHEYNTGSVVDASDPTKLASAMKKALQNKSRSIKKRTAIFTVEESVEQFLKLIPSRP